MDKKMDERIPREVGAQGFVNWPAASSPWNKLVSFHDALHYASRYNAVFSAALMQAYRILVPDYEERADEICKSAYARLYSRPGSEKQIEGYRNTHNLHPFCCGNFVGGLHGDWGDELQMMCGRVNDFGTYRVEKELDVCDWDIIGTELCRATTQSLMKGADLLDANDGPRLDYCMVEAKGAGDLHCRIVAEDRKKYPMPEHKFWETFGPIATADQIKHTPEEECLKEPEYFREECGYKFCSGTCEEYTAETARMFCGFSHGGTYVLPVIDDLINRGRLDEKFAVHVIKCCCEAAGKAVFGEFYAKKGLKEWLGAPEDLEDGRLMGASIEMFLQCASIKYDILAFNKDEVVYDIDPMVMCRIMPQMERVQDAFVSYWYGMTKTLVNAQWSLWREETTNGKLRIKIAKRIDKFC